jgi:hypothetical protein
VIKKILQWINPATSSVPSGTSVERCLEDPQAAQTELATSQAELAKQIEETFALYDQKLQDVALRIRSLSPEEQEHELENLAQAQDELKRVLRRFQAATKSTQDLQTELADWGEHPYEGGLHADHPAVRSEIIRSELALRNPGTRLINMRRPKPSAGARAEEGTYGVVVHEVNPWLIPDEAHLLAAIREATREAERWHAMAPQEYTEDALEQVHQVRSLHAFLKRLDKLNGLRRDRLALAINPRDTR